MVTRFRVLAIAVVIGVIAAACTTGTVPTGTAAAGLDLVLDEFTITPSGEVPADTPLQFRVRNEGAAPHSVALTADHNTYETRVLTSGGAETLQVPALPAGTYTLFCTVAGHREAGMETTLVVGSGGGTPQTSDGLTPQEVLEAHMESMTAFPAETEGLGGQPLPFEVIDGVKVFELVPQPVRWEVSPGEIVDAYAYNGQVPGPEIRVRRGDAIRVVVRNELPEHTTVHFHGLELPNEMDGVPFITQDPIAPGATFSYEFTVKDPPGTHMYHSHYNTTFQVGHGLLGSFVIEEPDPAWDAEHTVVLGDGPHGYTINGKGWPGTAPIVATRGDRVLIRFMNEGQQLHPMHLHGFHFEVVARDGYPLAQPYMLDTVTVAPGERYDVVVHATQRGAWAFHCHILSHVESEHGMHGMATAFIVE